MSQWTLIIRKHSIDAHERFHMTRPETISRLHCQTELNNKSWDRPKAKKVEGG